MVEDCLTSTRYLAAYYFWYFAAIGVSEPYLPPCWRSLGFSPPALGLLNAIAPAITVVAPFLWTAYADATRQGERIFLINTWIAALAAVLFPNLAGFWPMAAAVLIYAAFRTPLIPLANSTTFRAPAGRRQGYAAIRLWGTIGYILMAIGAGFLVDRIGLRAGMYGIALAMLACGVVGWVGRSRERSSFPSVHLGTFLQTLRDRRILLLLLTHALTFGVFYLAGVQMVDALVPDGLRATAQGLFASATFGPGGLVGNVLAGLLYESLGMARLYTVAAALAAGATVLYWVGTRLAGAGDRLGTVRIPVGGSR